MRRSGQIHPLTPVESKTVWNALHFQVRSLRFVALTSELRWQYKDPATRNCNPVTARTRTS